MASKRIKLGIEEQIEKKEESIKLLQNQKRQLEKKLNEQERKARIYMLISRRPILESLIENAVELTDEEIRILQENQQRQKNLKKHYDAEDLVGKTLLAIVNLPPRKMMGIDSEGMIISAIHE